MSHSQAKTTSSSSKEIKRQAAKAKPAAAAATAKKAVAASPDNTSQVSKDADQEEQEPVENNGAEDDAQLDGGGEQADNNARFTAIENALAELQTAQSETQTFQADIRALMQQLVGKQAQSMLPPAGPAAPKLPTKPAAKAAASSSLFSTTHDDSSVIETGVKAADADGMGRMSLPPQPAATSEKEVDAHKLRSTIIGIAESLPASSHQRLSHSYTKHIAELQMQLTLNRDVLRTSKLTARVLTHYFEKGSHDNSVKTWWAQQKVSRPWNGDYEAATKDDIDTLFAAFEILAKTFQTDFRELATKVFVPRDVNLTAKNFYVSCNAYEEKWQDFCQRTNINPVAADVVKIRNVLHLLYIQSSNNGAWEVIRTLYPGRHPEEGIVFSAEENAKIHNALSMSPLSSSNPPASTPQPKAETGQRRPKNFPSSTPPATPVVPKENSSTSVENTNNTGGVNNTGGKEKPRNKFPPCPECGNVNHPADKCWKKFPHLRPKPAATPAPAPSTTPGK